MKTLRLKGRRSSCWVAFLALILSGMILSGIAVAQDQPQPAPAATRPAAAKTLTVSGKVSKDGQIFVTDLDTEWNVSNADALKGREGRMVTVKCYIDTDRDQIHILSVKTVQSDKYASRQGDSAFRR